MTTSAGPIEAVCTEEGFVLMSDRSHEGDKYILHSVKHKDNRLLITMKSNLVDLDPGWSFFSWVDSPGFDTKSHGGKERIFKACDDAPAGVIAPIPDDLVFVRRGEFRDGELHQTCLVSSVPFPTVKVVGKTSETYIHWDAVGVNERNVDLGSEKKGEYAELFMALARWYNSETTTKFALIDNIQRVAGREMVAKVDKDQNVYVDMNELSRHRGWNFSISLEPARADVRIGNDHIKIYPGADRIHINDELVTLPGTVPTQGYGVYLPLRLLQERGYLPAEG